MSREPSHALTETERGRIEELDRLVARGAAATGELVRALDDRSWTVRRAAVGALAALGDPAVSALAIWIADQRTSEHAIAAAVDALVASIGSVTPVALQLLAHPNPAVAADAAAILGRRRTAEAVPALGATVAHPDDNVAVSAIEALGAIGGSVAIEPLIAVARTRSFFRTFPAIQVLARSGDPRAVAPLAELLADDAFRYEAARALGRTGAVQAIAPLADLLARSDVADARLVAHALSDLVARATWTGAAAAVRATMRERLAPSRGLLRAALAGAEPDDQAAVAGVLGTIGDADALRSLAPLLHEPALRGVATEAIQRIGATSEDALIATLRAPDPATKIAALPAVRTARAAADLRALLADDDAEVRARACDALARIGDVAAVPALFELLGDASPRAAQAATAAIHSLGGGETPALAIAALGSPHLNVRRHALRVIGYLGCAGAFAAVRALTAEADGRIAELAVVALGALDDAEVDTALGELAGDPREGVRGAAMRAASQRSSAAARVILVRGLTDAAAWVRYYACQGLGRRGHVDATPLLVAAMADAAAHVRIAAIDALAQLDGPEAWAALTTAVQSRDPDEQRAALVGIGHHARPAALPYLLTAESSGDLATRLIALAGLARQRTGPALGILSRAALSADEALRDSALSLLAERTDRAAADALVETAIAAPADHPSHFALSRTGTERIAAIAARLATAGDALATPLAAALARMADPAAVEALRTLLASPAPSARRAAATALAAIGQALDQISRMAVEDPDPDVRRVCAAASAG